MSSFIKKNLFSVHKLTIKDNTCAIYNGNHYVQTILQMFKPFLILSIECKNAVFSACYVENSIFNDMHRSKIRTLMK